MPCPFAHPSPIQCALDQRTSTGTGATQSPPPTHARVPLRTLAAIDGLSAREFPFPLVPPATSLRSLLGSLSGREQHGLQLPLLAPELVSFAGAVNVDTRTGESVASLSHPAPAPAPAPAPSAAVVPFSASHHSAALSPHPLRPSPAPPSPLLRVPQTDDHCLHISQTRGDVLDPERDALPVRLAWSLTDERRRKENELPTYRVSIPCSSPLPFFPLALHTAPRPPLRPALSHIIFPRYRRPPVAFHHARTRQLPPVGELRWMGICTFTLVVYSAPLPVHVRPHHAALSPPSLLSPGVHRPNVLLLVNVFLARCRCNRCDSSERDRRRWAAWGKVGLAGWFSGGISFYSVFLSRAFQILLEATGDQSGAGPVSILISLLPPHAPPTIIAFPFLPSTPCVFSPVLTLFSLTQTLMRGDLRSIQYIFILLLLFGAIFCQIVLLWPPSSRDPAFDFLGGCRGYVPAAQAFPTLGRYSSGRDGMRGFGYMPHVYLPRFRGDAAEAIMHASLVVRTGMLEGSSEMVDGTFV
ncbi:hypothetical protein B0H13DRAFT_2535485 [Mycena leptocephala]|nr:hypothetical protein B0H13DRAFT_2535485 [Mycena leptocephala]